MPEVTCPTCKTPIPEDAAFCSRCGTQSPTVISGAGPVAPQPVADPGVQERLATALGGKYEVRRLLGHGGFAEVYEVWDRDLHRRLAVKVLKPDIAWSSGMLERFKQEARAIARLNHPNILPIHFVGDGEGLVFYAMPFVDGQSLGTLLRTEGALAPDRALSIIKPILEALAHAHQSGLIHRDIKPDNVMIEAGTGRPLLVDFGIAKQVDGGAANLTQTGFVVGTPQYMSPEQALGQGNIDARSDIYALGALLFQMVTGAPPYEGESSQEIVGKHLTEPVPIPTTKNAKIPGWLSEVIVRCLAKRPGERFQSAVMVLDALQSGRASGSQQPISAERVAKRIQDEATEVMPSKERAAARPRTPGGSGGGRWWLWAVGAGVAVVAAGLFLRMGARPTLAIENRLIEPIKVTFNTENLQVAPGGTVRLKLPRGERLVAQWFLVRPASRNGDPMGSDLQGSIVVERPKGIIRRVIDSGSAGAPFFSPLITNNTKGSVGIIVNFGSAAAVDCYCPMLPGAARQHIGYYPLYLNSSVRAYAVDGRTATFKDLGPEVDKASGLVGLRFEDKDLR